MPIAFVDHYEVDHTAEPLRGTRQWGAYVAIFTPSGSPMHRDNVFPKHRVMADHVFTTEAEAEQAAHAEGLTVLERLRQPHQY